MQFDQSMKLVQGGSGAYQVTGDGSWTIIGTNGQPVKILEDGYIIVTIHDRSERPVWFDRLQVLFHRGKLKEEDHYYPYGLPMANIGSTAAGMMPNRRKYQGNEFVTEAGLNWMSFGARQYDPQIGRFLSIDPLAGAGEQDRFSPYAAMGDAPAANVDPNGMQYFTTRSAGDQLTDIATSNAYMISHYRDLDFSGNHFSSSLLKGGGGGSSDQVLYLQGADAKKFWALLTGQPYNNTQQSSFANNNLYDGAMACAGCSLSMLEEGASDDGDGDLPDYIRKQARDKGIIISSESNELDNNILTIHSTSEAKKHYKNGHGEPVQISDESLREFEYSDAFQTYVDHIITGKTSSMSGYLSVDMTYSSFYIGRTNFNYNITCGSKTCNVQFNVFVNDGFWDPNELAEKLGFSKPDGMGPNLESNGTPYYFIPRTVNYTFYNPGYTPNE